jgi:alpha-galactosidase
MDAPVITFVGAGSVGFTRRLMQDILAVPEFAACEFRFQDISQRNLDMVAALCRRDIAANGLAARIVATTDQRSAVAGADVVIVTFRVGGLPAFATDIDIPLRYGVDQCVGDTLCAGGVMYHQRNAPVLLALCADIRAAAKPGCLLLNYANPMAMNTWLCNAYGGVRTIGLCHGVQGAHWQITRAIEHWLKSTGRLAADYVSPGCELRDHGLGLGPVFGMHRREVDVIAAGLNHQTWFVQVGWRGEDLTARLPELMRAIPHFRQTEKVRLDVLDRFGYYSTESNGHLSEYLPWYRKRPEAIAGWTDPSCWIHGETGGYLRVCTEGRSWFEHEFPAWMAETPPVISQTSRSEEHGSYIIEALRTGRTYRGHFNVVNRGHITNLPDGCVVEIPGYVDRTGLHSPVVGDLPLACAATCAASVRVQEMAMEAARRGDALLLKQAMLHDPLIGAVCSPAEVWQMADEMLVAQAEWLPQYAAEIPRAAARLAAQVADGTRVRPRDDGGATRQRIKDVAALAEDRAAARTLAAADKAGLTGAA